MKSCRKVPADWIFVDGKVKFNDSFYGSIVKTRPDIEARLKNNVSNDDRGQFLNDNIKDTKENGSASYFIRMKTSVKIKNPGDKLGKIIKVHMPLPIECQQSDIKIISTTPVAKYMSSADYPQRTAYFETKLEGPQEFSVEYSFKSTLTYNNPDPLLVSEEQPKFFTEEQEPHIMFTPYIRELANEIVGDETNPLIKARKIYDYITQNVRYSYMRAYSTITNIPEYAALNLKGDCGVQGLLFITLLRCAGIPARWQSGLAVTPQHIGPHDWTQFYVNLLGGCLQILHLGEEL